MGFQMDCDSLNIYELHARWVACLLSGRRAQEASYPPGRTRS